MPYIQTMASSTAISIEEYLFTPYKPDCDYVDGELVERNVGKSKHSVLQRILTRYLGERSRQLRIRVCPELRLRVSPTRFRLTLKRQPSEPVLTRPPFSASRSSRPKAE